MAPGEEDARGGPPGGGPAGFDLLGMGRRLSPLDCRKGIAGPMANRPAEAEYTIAAVSKLTGVSCHALRVWERRYGYPVPGRSASGHRRYGLDQVTTLKRLSELTRQGRSIGDLMNEVAAGRLVVGSGPATDPVSGPPAGSEVDELLGYLLRGDLPGADSCFENTASRRAADDTFAGVIAHALTETGERWFRRRVAVFQERCVSGFLRRKLGAMIDEARSANLAPRRTVILGAVQGDRHEGGVLLANLMLERAGWRVINLGVDLPVSEYVRAAESFRPDALALSFILSRNIQKRFHELTEVRGLPVFVGGRSILNYQSLARRHGLIPVPGPVSAAIEQMTAEIENWPDPARIDPPAR